MAVEPASLSRGTRQDGRSLLLRGSGRLLLKCVIAVVLPGHRRISLASIDYLLAADRTFRC